MVYFGESGEIPETAPVQRRDRLSCCVGSVDTQKLPNLYFIQWILGFQHRGVGIVLDVLSRGGAGSVLNPMQTDQPSSNILANRGFRRLDLEVFP
jgi:hypothetical protein